MRSWIGKACFLFFYSGTIIPLGAQSTSWLVQLHPTFTHIDSLLRPNETAHSIYDALNLWEVKGVSHASPVGIKKNEVPYWNQLPQVKWARPCRPVAKRIAPNDPFFGNQSYLSHINLEYVWNFQKGGVNVFGDTLVIAYIDDGADVDHPDLKDNMFRNHQEIPFNAVDDDLNGYVDDYWGWNSGNQDARVFSGTSVVDGHGTRVAGIMGARGNNGIGISGVNWNIKLLPINTYADDFSEIEASVLRGMVYVLKQKQLFLTSNKTKGANIVALNMSLGMDNAFPEDAPVWCDLFDSLGAVGIWSYSATSNRNIDVGKSGDIPTLCPSTFLISVNASNLNDGHHSSGFSDTFIELAAPGVNIFSTVPRELSPQNPYSSESGTSFASPLVAGISALMESLSCRNYIKLKEEDPFEAMKLWRLWMKASVVKSDALKTKTLWGGRIDAEALFGEMSKWCMLNDTSYNRSNAADEIIRIQLWPNPSSSELYLNIHDRGVLRCYDAVGRIIYDRTLDAGNHILNIQGISGLVFFDFITDTGYRQRKSHIFLQR
jgi:hypothetical protein